MTLPESSLLKPRRIVGVLVKLMFAALYCFGLSRLVLNLLNLPLDPLPQGLAIVICLTVLASLTWQRYNLLIFGSSWLVLLMAAIIWREDLEEPAYYAVVRLRLWLGWAVDQLAPPDMFPSQMDYVGRTDILAIVVCSLLAIVCYLGLARFSWPGAAILALLLVGVSHELFRSGGLPWAMLAALAAIAAAARNQRRAYRGLGWIRHPAQAHFMLESLPLAVTAIALAAACAAIWPASAWQSASLALRLDVLRSEIGVTQDGIVPSSGQIYEFSISSAGFYPLGDRLGGPVTLSDTPVMTVAGYTDGMLLRGAIARTYTGNSWLPNDDVDLYDFNDQRWETKRVEAFDLDLPSPESLIYSPSSQLEQISYAYTPVDQSMTTVFINGKPDFFTRNDAQQQVYFSSQGLLFQQPALAAGQKLTVTSTIMHSDWADFEFAQYFSNRLPEPAQTRYEAAAAAYLQLPDRQEYQPDGELSRLAASLVDPGASAWENAQAIKAYLIEKCRYNLKVGAPPYEREFVSHFLETGEGYCVYFATAETMLCRLAGIPARYVEGYVVGPGETETEERLVTGLNAHAWTEIYLLGIGWIPIDATAGSTDAVPEATPTPSISPGKPSPGPDDPNQPTPTVRPATPTPSSGPRPGDQTIGQWLSDFMKAIRKLSPWWLLTLFALPIIGLTQMIVRYRRRFMPGWLEKHFPDPRRRVIYCWQDMLSILAMLGVSHLLYETPRQLTERVQKETTWLAGRRPDVELMLSGVEQALFSSELPTPEETDAVTRLYLILEKTLRQNTSRLLFLFRRIWYHKQKHSLED